MRKGLFLVIAFLMLVFITGGCSSSSGNREQQASAKALELTKEHYSSISGTHSSGYKVSFGEPEIKSIETHLDKYFDFVIVVEAFVEGFGESDIQELTSVMRLKLTDSGDYVMEGPPGYGSWVKPGD